MKKSAGILLHPSSLPSPYGIGDFGVEAYRFVDWLKKTGLRYWQILPLNIPDATGSPYASASAMAGNWMLISPQLLVCDNLLPVNELPPKKPIGPVNFSKIYVERQNLLWKSFNYFQQYGHQAQKNNFTSWQKSQKVWLDDYALFSAIKDYYHGRTWYKWPKPLAQRQIKTMRGWSAKLTHQINFYKFCQWVFFTQWYYLKTYANRRRIKIIGDLPFFVCHDSVDVWSHQKMFKLNKRHQPAFISGVPPDYYSAKGQIWSDPQYDWHQIEKNGFSWWIKRIQQALMLYDLVRLDHFRGYEAVWYIKYGSLTARIGHWEKVPGEKLFSALQKKFGALPFIAEDLGIITHEVTSLRKKFGFPSTRVLQFSFDGLPDNTHLPKNYSGHIFAYSGTHDNDTARGWISHSGKPSERRLALQTTKSTIKKFAEKLIKLGLQSKAEVFIAPIQDFLNLGRGARLNRPGTKKNNWNWRMAGAWLTENTAKEILRLLQINKRV